MGETVPPFTTLYVTTYGRGVTVVAVTAVGLEPVELFATTENLYAVPFVNPSIMQLVADGTTVQVSGPGTGFPDESRAVTMYEVAAPTVVVPSADDVIDTVALSLNASAVKVGVAGGRITHCA